MDDFSNRDRLRLIVCDWLLTSYGSEITAAAEDIQILFDRCLLYVPLDEGASLALSTGVAPGTSTSGSDVVAFEKALAKATSRKRRSI